MTQQDPTLSRANLELVTIAGEFCNLIESCQSHDRTTFLKTLRSFVPLLYLRGSLIQAELPAFPDANERFVTEEQWDGLFTSMRELLADKDEFFYAGISEYGEDTLLRGSLSEHLADIYQDLKDFILLFKKPSLASRENAIYECSTLFDERWGQRLSNILPIIHTFNSRPTKDTDFQDDFPDIF